MTLHVLHVTPSVSLVDGGPSVAVAELAAECAAQGARVTIATTDADGAGRLDVELGVPVTERGVEYRYFARTLAVGWKPSLSLARWLRTEAGRYDVIHVHALFTYATIPGCASARRAGVPNVLTPHGMLDPGSLTRRSWKKRPYYLAVERRNVLGAAALHATSAFEGDALAALGLGASTRVVPLGVRAPSLRRVERAVGAPLRLLFVGRLHPIKGLPRLIDALADPVSGSASLVVAGGGDVTYRAELEARARATGVAQRVRFAGPVDGGEKWRLFEEADAFVLPSHHENFGLAAAEALAAGVPVIVTDQVGLARDVAESGAGCVVDGSAASLAGAIASLANDETGRRGMADRAGALARERYAWDRAARRMLDLYGEVIASSAVRA